MHSPCMLRSQRPTKPGDGSRVPMQRYGAWEGAGFPTLPKKSLPEKSVPLVHAVWELSFLETEVLTGLRVSPNR